MMVNPLDYPGLLALLGAIFGGTGVRLLDRHLRKTEKAEDSVTEDVQQFRKDLLDYNKGLREQLENRINAQITSLEQHQKALDELRAAYSVLESKYSALAVRYELQIKALEQHQKELNELHAMYDTLEKDHEDLVARYEILAMRCSALESSVPQEQLQMVRDLIKPSSEKREKPEHEEEI